MIRDRDSYKGNSNILVRLLIASQSLVEEGVEWSYKIIRKKLQYYLSPHHMTYGDQTKLIEVHTSYIVETDNTVIQSVPSPAVPKGIRL